MARDQINEGMVISKIYIVRGHKVMMDRDLAELYDVETKYLKRQVRRNDKRFPEDFMFEMTKEELSEWRSQFGTSNTDKMGLRYTPMVFTEQGVAMLSGVLNSDRSIEVNIQIMRIFTRMRELLLNHQELLLKIERMEQEMYTQGDDIQLIFDYLKQLIEEPNPERRQIGFNRNEKS